jgi:hypothetical protein
MWKHLGLIVTDFENTPGKEAVIAAAFRQLLRAHIAADRIAIWSATSVFCTRLRLWLGDLLSREASWDSKGRWLEGFGLSSSRILYHEADRVIRLADAMVWGLSANPGGAQWAEPFMLEMTLTLDLSDLASYTVHFGDRSEHPGEEFQFSLSRIERELETNVIDWAFVFRRVEAGIATNS